VNAKSKAALFKDQSQGRNQNKQIPQAVRDILLLKSARFRKLYVKVKVLGGEFL